MAGGDGKGLVAFVDNLAGDILGVDTASRPFQGEVVGY
jgi:hypothetical protein